MKTENETKTTLDLDAERVRFEAACVVHFGQWLEAGNTGSYNGCPTTRESLCWKTDDGFYGVRALNAAWWGWQQGQQRG